MIQIAFAQKIEPGTAIFIQKNNLQTYQGYANVSDKTPIDETTNFRMASVSKQFTAACIILLKNSKLVSYNDKLNRFFPSFKNGDKVSIWHLLTHTSGLYDYENLIPENQTEQVTDADVVRWVGETEEMNFAPGTKFKYSNTGFCILEQIVEKISGKPYAEFIKKISFSPWE